MLHDLYCFLFCIYRCLCICILVYPFAYDVFVFVFVVIRGERSINVLSSRPGLCLCLCPDPSTHFVSCTGVPWWYSAEHQVVSFYLLFLAMGSLRAFNFSPLWSVFFSGRPSTQFASCTGAVVILSRAPRSIFLTFSIQEDNLSLASGSLRAFNSSL